MLELNKAFFFCSETGAFVLMASLMNAIAFHAPVENKRI